MPTFRASLACVLVALALVNATAGLASAASLYAATYQVPAAPKTMPAGGTTPVQLTVTNAGTATWNTTGANPVNVSYHWYDQAGGVAVWDGARTPLGADVAPNQSRTLGANVTAPAKPGTYALRFALVKEGVIWFDPAPVPASVQVLAAYAASYGVLASAPKFIAATTTTVQLTVTNAGSAIWNATGPTPVNVSYHWHDGAGNTVVWDGLRTPLGGDVAPGASKTLGVKVAAPPNAGAFALTFDLVREGVAWFGSPLKVAATVDPVLYRATYAVAATASGFVGETKTLPVTVANSGNTVWNASGPAAVFLSYHWYASDGRVVVWDGVRTALGGDLAPTQSRTVNLNLALPSQVGAYTLKLDLVREGVAWFSTLGQAPTSIAFQVTIGLGAGYGADTTPTQMSMNAEMVLSLQLFNTGQRAWPAGGPNPVRLAYHVYGAATGGLVVWDGVRTLLPRDVAPGQSITLDVVAITPGKIGTYRYVWDLVQEGLWWFSALGIPGKSSQVEVFPGVTLYGKGWGHGVGLSQWGAQGWATGAGGAPLTGEQIIAKYYPTAQITPIPAGAKNFRVKLSSPYNGCIGATITNFSQQRSDGGVRLTNQATNQVLLDAAPTQTVRIWVDGTTLKVMDEWSGRIVYQGQATLLLAPKDAAKPIFVVQKTRAYRGSLAYDMAGFASLRVINWVDPTDYTRGAVPVEMPSTWHHEALKAQAYAARTYAAWKQQTYATREFDLGDDTRDQCYGGASSEKDSTNAAVAATAGKWVTFNGQPISAYYASSNGGGVAPSGCVWGLVRSGSSYACGSSEPYLAFVPDPADPKAVAPSGPNPHRAWSVTFTSAQVRQRVLSFSGVDIGEFQQMDLSNRDPSGHVISVRIRGTFGSVDLRGDDFLRGFPRGLGLKSTMVRLSPF